MNNARNIMTSIVSVYQPALYIQLRFAVAIGVDTETLLSPSHLFFSKAQRRRCSLKNVKGAPSTDAEERSLDSDIAQNLQFLFPFSLRIV
jgi:hypothetical protein